MWMGTIIRQSSHPGTIRRIVYETRRLHLLTGYERNGEFSPTTNRFSVISSLTTFDKPQEEFMKWLAVAIGVALLSSCLAQGNAQTQKKTGTTTIKMWDACDPDSFNAVFGT
jgi:hypothetical protein